MSILHGRAIRYRTITYRRKLSEREEIIEAFNRDENEVIVAMKILDEGIDVPGIERAIILASSGNPIEYIQRRGRILRTSPGKTRAIIHDVLIFPWQTVPDNTPAGEIALLRKELRRIREFTLTARNPLEVMNRISRYAALL